MKFTCEKQASSGGIVDNAQDLKMVYLEVKSFKYARLYQWPVLYTYYDLKWWLELSVSDTPNCGIMFTIVIDDTC